jgi:ssDNA-binding replication factor A large subunit
MENFVILGRVLFVNPTRTFINKRGVESAISSIEIGDKSGTIECTMFGELAQRFEGKFKEDQVYEIANAQVT